LVMLEISSALLRYNFAFSRISCFFWWSFSYCIAGIKYSIDCK
jgi:hypothetical protein